jgi:hypothetical protein
LPIRVDRLTASLDAKDYYGNRTSLQIVVSIETNYAYSYADFNFYSSQYNYFKVGEFSVGEIELTLVNVSNHPSDDNVVVDVGMSKLTFDDNPFWI